MSKIGKIDVVVVLTDVLMVLLTEVLMVMLMVVLTDVLMVLLIEVFMVVLMVVLTDVLMALVMAAVNDVLMALFMVFPQQTLLLQMNEMKSQVDEVRDLAITLMSRSDRFTPMVEPELTHLNQRWEEVAQLLKVRVR